MGPTFTKKKGRTYRYYLCVHASKNGYQICPVRTVAAGTIETAVIDQLRVVFRSPELIALLAPDIVEAILRGVEPSGLSPGRLTKQLPVEWPRQRAALGFPSR